MPEQLSGITLGSDHLYPGPCPGLWVQALGSTNSFSDPSTTSTLSSWFYLVYLIWYFYLSLKFVMWIVKQKIEIIRKFFLNRDRERERLREREREREREWERGKGRKEIVEPKVKKHYPPLWDWRGRWFSSKILPSKSVRTSMSSMYLSIILSVSNVGIPDCY